MQKKLSFLIVIVFTVMIAVIAVELSAQQASDAIVGKWWTSDKAAKVEIAKCGGDYCGTFIWIKDDNQKNAPLLDTKNADPTLRSRPLKGLVFLRKLHFDGSKWTGGSVYDPEEGQDYNCTVSLTQDGQLELRGYVGLPMFGRSEYWKKE
jgi:uncharacterized protein (DUF2147 family)